jgi:hypothetical protein
VKADWTIKQKEKGASNNAVAESMSVSARRVQESSSASRVTATPPQLKRPRAYKRHGSGIEVAEGAKKKGWGCITKPQLYTGCSW